MKFWIVIGLLLLISGVGFGVWFVPLKKEAGSQVAAWEQKARTAKQLADKAEQLHGRADIEEAGKLKAAYHEQLKDVMGALEEKGKLLQRFIPDPETGQELQHEGGVWKVIYEQQMNALEQEVRKSFAVAPPSFVLRQSWPSGRWPSEDEMKEGAKMYWLQKYLLLEALADTNRARMIVPVFDSFKLLARPERLLMSTHGTLFQPQGFEIQVRTEFKNIPFLLVQLLKCKVPLALTSLAIERGAGGASVVAEGTLVRKAAARTGGPSLGPSGPSTAGPGPAPGVGPGKGRPTWIPVEGPPVEAFAGGPHGPAEAEEVYAPATAGAQPPPSVRVPGVPTAPKPLVLGQPATGAEALPREIVNVTVRGYVLEYAPPKAAAQPGRP